MSGSVPTSLRAIADHVEARLDELLSAEAERWAAFDPDLAHPVNEIRRLVLSGGKRLRPAFCHWGYVGAGGGTDDQIDVDAGAAFELMHAFALFHDDVMDDASTRRGQPTTHAVAAAEHTANGWAGESRRFGEGVAILVGDLAFVYADRLLEAASPEAMRIWNELRIELNIGQYLDILGSVQSVRDVEKAERICRYKSGKYTIERPLHLGAVLAAPERADELLPALSAYGLPLGDAFQMRDDVMGAFGDSEVTGKPVGGDLREGKPTPLLARAVRSATLRTARGARPGRTTGHRRRHRRPHPADHRRHRGPGRARSPHHRADHSGGRVARRRTDRRAGQARAHPARRLRELEERLMKVVVIGAGLGGLSAAAHLVGAGHQVTIVEREAIPGGRAGMIVSEGFRLDNGPTVLTMPNLLEDAFNACGTDMADHLTIHPVDPMYRAVFADGSTLFVRHGREAMTQEIREFSDAKNAEAFGRFCDWLEKLYRAEMNSFIDANFNTPLDLIKPWKSGLELVKLGGFGKLDKKVASFFDDERLQRIFSFQSMYAGLAPYEALALYAVITYMDSVQGVFVPEGGMHMMAAGLAEAVRDAGVEIRYDSPVTRILRKPNGPVVGVEIGASERLDADAVVCNPDLPVAYRELLPGVTAPRAARNGKYSPSCLLWVAGVKGLPPDDAAHHNIHFGKDWDGSFKALIDDGVRMPDPSRPRHVAQPRRPLARPRGTLEHLRARTHTEPERQDRLVEGTRHHRRQSARTGRFARLPDRGGRRGDLRPDRLGTHGHGTGHAVRARPHVLPDRPVPAEQRQPQGARTRVHRLVDAARRRRADGARVGQARRRAGRAVRTAATPMSALDRLRRKPPVPTTHLLPTGPVTLDESYELCREFNKRHGTTYYWSTKVLPKVKQHHVHALYAFARYADDIVDEIPSQGGNDVPTEVRAAALADFGDRFFADLDAGKSDDPVLKAVVHTVRAFDIDPDGFRRFLRSMTMDLTVESYATWADLLVYMDGSAAVIGEMMLPILEPVDYHAALPHARDLGNAFQLTNFLRDIDEDLDRGRQYIPLEDSERFGVDLTKRQVTPSFVGLMQFEIERCRALYASAEIGIAMLPDRSAKCVRAAHTLYGRILDKIEAQHYDVFSSRASVSTTEKAVMVTKLLLP